MTFKPLFVYSNALPDFLLPALSICSSLYKIQVTANPHCKALLTDFCRTSGPFLSRLAPQKRRTLEHSRHIIAISVGTLYVHKSTQIVVSHFSFLASLFPFLSSSVSMPLLGFFAKWTGYTDANTLAANPNHCLVVLNKMETTSRDLQIMSWSYNNST